MRRIVDVFDRNEAFFFDTLNFFFHLFSLLDQLWFGGRGHEELWFQGFGFGASVGTIPFVSLSLLFLGVHEGMSRILSDGKTYHRTHSLAVVVAVD